MPFSTSLPSLPYPSHSIFPNLQGPSSYQQAPHLKQLPLNSTLHHKASGPYRQSTSQTTPWPRPSMTTQKSFAIPRFLATPRPTAAVMLSLKCRCISLIPFIPLGPGGGGILILGCRDGISAVSRRSSSKLFLLSFIWCVWRWEQYWLIRYERIADGTCTIDLTQTSRLSHVRWFNIFSAASLIQSQCCDINDPPFGGQAYQLGNLVPNFVQTSFISDVSRYIGLEDNFQVTTKINNPGVVRCRNQPLPQRPSSSACKTILDTMKAGTAISQFSAVGAGGPRDDKVPLILTERKYAPSHQMAEFTCWKQNH